MSYMLISRLLKSRSVLATSSLAALVLCFAIPIKVTRILGAYHSDALSKIAAPVVKALDDGNISALQCGTSTFVDEYLIDGKKQILTARCPTDDPLYIDLHRNVTIVNLFSGRSEVERKLKSVDYDERAKRFELLAAALRLRNTALVEKEKNRVLLEVKDREDAGRARASWESRERALHADAK